MRHRIYYRDMEAIVRVLAGTMLVASVAFATSIAIEAASAQTKYKEPKPRVTAPPSEVRTGGKPIIDPDPFIRGEILRHRNSGWPD
jgi:hypothetical protein